MLQTWWIFTELSLLCVSVQHKSIYLFVGSRIWPEDAILRKKSPLYHHYHHVIEKSYVWCVCFKIGLVDGVVVVNETYWADLVTHTFIHSSSKWHDGADDKEDISSSILHPRVRFLNQQRDEYFCPRLIQKVDLVLWKFNKFEASILSKTFPQRNLVPSYD